MTRGLLTLSALWSAAASAQPVFFDDFDGPDLLPHWRAPDPSHWEYDVSGGMLNVTGLFYPGIPHLGGNFAAIGASFVPQTDFRVDAWMGWEAGDDPHGIAIQMLAAGVTAVAEFKYSDEEPGRPPILIAGSGTEAVTAPAPPPGLYQFTIARIDAEFEFYLDGSLFARLPDRRGRLADTVAFDFLGPNPPAQLGAFHIDRVLVVPAPGVLLVSLSLSLACVRRTRR